MRVIFLILAILTLLLSCKKTVKPDFALSVSPQCRVDSVALAWFFAKHPLLGEHRQDVMDMYREKADCAWFSAGRLSEQAHVLYSRLLELEDEGLPSEVPYFAELETVMSRATPEVNSEILLSALYYHYTCLIYGGLDHDRAIETGWFIPREKSIYPTHIDSVLRNSGKRIFFPQYYNLRKALKKYRDIQHAGGWDSIAVPPGKPSYRQGDSAQVVGSVRARLKAEGFNAGSGGDIFDESLAAAIQKYLVTNVRTPQKTITPELVSLLNVPVSSRIKSISINMERCRWISPRLASAPQYIAVNIPSYSLLYFVDGKPALRSRVVVGKELNQTVVFSGEISYIAFSPYWNVPPSILKNEILPAIDNDPGYLRKHNMEWHDGRVRQRPGPNNSLGLVKFMFPNANNIYLHDTPAKSLFGRDQRAFSHGCVRVEKARELAIAITKNDGGWTAKGVDEAMNKGSENYYILKNKIPVYIAYFTAWADEDGNTAFFDDVYKRDPALAALLYKPGSH